MVCSFDDETRNGAVPSELRPSTISFGCGLDRGGDMQVPMIEMRAFEGKTQASVSLPVRRSRIPTSYPTPWLGSIQAIGSSASVPVPECLPLGWTSAPSGCSCRSKCPETDLDSSKSHGLSSLLPTSPLTEESFAQRPRVATAQRIITPWLSIEPPSA